MSVVTIAEAWPAAGRPFTVAAVSPELISAERGDLQYQSIEITEDEANRIVARIRAEVTGTSNG